MAEQNPVDQIRKAAAGLQYQSESDYPIEPLCWPARDLGPHTEPSPEALKTCKALPPDVPVEEDSVEGFFAPATEDQDWFGAEEKAMAARFQALVATLQSTLTDLRVFKVGDNPKAVYVVGKTGTGDLAGVTTRVVET